MQHWMFLAHFPATDPPAGSLPVQAVAGGFMPRVCPVPPVSRRVRALLFFLSLACASSLSGGCANAHYAAGPEFSPQTHDYLRIDDTAAYEACLAGCLENSSLALVTRTGCIAGCEEARRTFPLRNKVFSSRQDCLDALVQQETRKDRLILEMRQWCDSQWTHVHNRKGCHMAAEAFYANLTPAGMCGADGSETVAYDTPFAQRPEPGPGNAADRTSPALAPTGSTQPSGPLIPPPFVPEEAPRQSGAAPVSSAPPQVPGQFPAIHDTPKYQKSPMTDSRASKSAPAPAESAPPKATATSPTNGKTATPPPQPTPAKDATPPAAVHAPAPPVPAHPTAPAAGSATPPASAATPQSIPATTPANPEPPAPMPVSPQNHPEPEPQPRPEAPAVPEIPSRPSVAPDSVPPGQTTLPGGIPDTALPFGSQQPDPPATTQAQPARSPDTPAAMPPEPETRRVPPISPGPPLPGQNANRPVPPNPEPAQPAPPALIPPVPSMLNRPYNTPSIIAPQIEVPE